MTRYDLIARAAVLTGALLAGTGDMVGSSPASHLSATAPAPRGPEARTPDSAPDGQRNAEVPKVDPSRQAGAAEGATPTAPAKPQVPDPQTDEGAGKGADLAKIATSPRIGSPYLGPKDSPVAVNVFSDFQCPVCRRSADPIKQLVLDFPGKVMVVFRHNALPMHGRSRPAALAAMAAGMQGKFWQFHDKLFASQRALDDGSLRRVAEGLTLDLAQWDKDIADPNHAARVAEEASWAAKLGAASTPAFFVNGVRKIGWGSYLSLKAVVAREIAACEALEESGARPPRIREERIRAMADKNPPREGDAPIDVDLWVDLLTAD